MNEYEARKKKELSELNTEWEYVRCHNRNKGKHVVKCVYCGTEKITENLNKIPFCSVCKRNKDKALKEQSKYKVCVKCGAIFRPQRSTALYCSERCLRKAKFERHIEAVREKRRINKRLREAKATRNGKIDYSITLSKLIERDNHICKLCGREVNESDYVYSGDTFIAGNDYPSIDHIKPLSKGGVHQWNNVQLAHRLCNSLKNNNEIEK